MSTSQKLWHLLNFDQRRAATVLLALMMISMLLETLGIGLIIPAVAVMTESDIASKYPMLAPWLNSIGNPSHEELITVSMLTLVAIYAVKTLFLTYITWRQIRFVSHLQVDFSQRLFSGYLRQPYTFHLQRNSAQLIQNTTHQARSVANAIHQSLLLISETLVLFGVSALLIKVEPLGTTLVVSTLGLIGWGFHRVSRSHILRWGKANQRHEELRYQRLQEGLGGVKDVKLLGRESDFLNQYAMHSISGARLDQRQSTLQALPRLWLELLAVTGLVALVLVMIGQGKPMDALIPTLGLFAAAAFRLMPSVSRILATVQGMRFSLPVIDTIFAELCLIGVTHAPRCDKSLPLKMDLVLDSVNFQYQTAATPALREISLSIPRGSSVGFIGGSGAGKSTLVDIILGLLTPGSGTVKVDGIDIQSRLRSWQDQIGYVPQSIFLTDDTLRRNVAFGLPNDQINEAAVLHAIHAAQLEQFVREQPDGLDTIVGERGIRLSGGQRQRIGIARAIYHDPAVLVLDEATSSLDTATEHDVMEAVRAMRGRKTLLIVSHRLSTVEHCDHLFRIDRGRLVAEGKTAMVLGLAT